MDAGAGDDALVSLGAVAAAEDARRLGRAGGAGGWGVGRLPAQDDN